MANNSHTKQSTTIKYYINEIHMLRALACICVLMVHVTACYYLMQGERFNWLTYALNQLGRFGTPMFAVISAFLLFNQVRRRGFQLKKFLTSRTTKILLPFLIWSGVYVILKKVFLGVGFKRGLSPEEFFIEYFVLGSAYYHLYFIAMIIQFYLLFIFLQLVRTKKAWVILLVTGLIINLFILYSGTLGINIENHFFRLVYYDKAFVFRWIFYFLFGGFLAYFWEYIIPLLNRVRVILFPIGIIVVVGAIAEYMIQGSVASYRVSNFINIPLLSFVIIGLHSYVNKWKSVEKVFALIGNMSMGIYLIHPLVLFLFMEFLPSFFWSTRWLPLIFVLVLLLCIFITRLIQFIPVGNYILPVPKASITKGKAA